MRITAFVDHVVTVFYISATVYSMAGILSTFRLDPGSGVGIAAQIRARMAFLIADGELAPGDRLPPVRDLAGQLGVNVNTVRSAYTKLQADGLVRTRHGVGTVVLAAPADSLRTHGVHPLGVNAVAVLIGGLNPFYLPLLEGIEDVAVEHGTLVLIAGTRDSPALAETMIRRLIARGIDGIIAVSVGGITERRGRGVTSGGRLPPIVYVDQPERTGHVLLFDGHAGGYAATRHLREHGHARIGIVTAPLAWPNVREVYEGYAHALDDARSVSPSLVSEVGEFSIDAGRLGLAHLLDAPDPPSAVFAAGEVLALGVLREAKARGIDVPGQLAITGYTDSPATALVEPPLTMVSVPAREIGIQAMRTLADLIGGKKLPSRRTVLDVELVLRDSCGSH